MKCYEVTGCSEERRAACFVYRNFHNITGSMENISCWILKHGGSGAPPEEATKCAACSYYIAVNRHGITVRTDDSDIVVIECTGTLNTLRTAVLSEVADKLKSQNRNKIILDLSAATNIYSCAMGLIVRLHKQCEEMGGMFVMAGATGYVKVAIGTVSLDRFIKITETAEVAVEMMKKNQKLYLLCTPSPKDF